MSNDNGDLVEKMRNVPSYQSWPGELKLVLALLENALLMYQKHALPKTRTGWEFFKESREWIENDNQKSPLSFSMVCEILELDRDYIRRKLRAWYESQITPRSRASQEKKNKKASANGRKSVAA